MAPTQPVLAGTTLPHPSNNDDGSGWVEDLDYRGASIQTFDQTQLTKLVQTGAKTLHTLEWRDVSAADKATIITAYQALIDSPVSYTAPDGDTFTVTRDGDDSLVFGHTLSADKGVRHTVTLTLREV